jgi:hypothetical protein
MSSRKRRKLGRQRRARTQRCEYFVPSARKSICQIGQMLFAAADLSRRTYLQDAH